jgi:tripartite-type tricarboxylate transporter receptor subunit TctC
MKPQNAKRRLLRAAGSLAVLSLAGAPRAFAQGYPTRTIRIVVPW